MVCVNAQPVGNGSGNAAELFVALSLLVVDEESNNIGVLVAVLLLPSASLLFSSFDVSKTGVLVAVLLSSWWLFLNHLPFPK